MDKTPTEENQNTKEKYPKIYNPVPKLTTKQLRRMERESLEYSPKLNDAFKVFIAIALITLIGFIIY